MTYDYIQDTSENSFTIKIRMEILHICQQFYDIAPLPHLFSQYQTTEGLQYGISSGIIQNK